MSENAKAIPLYFITGFLGSGKTTLLNHALDEAAAREIRLGVIINEWGQVSIDAGLVPAASNELEIKELNDGQVFCSCLTVDFIKALQLFAKMNLDAVIIETSGMANPFPLKQLLKDLADKTGDCYIYRSMTALVDPESFLELLGVINAVEEQITASQRIVINKIDISPPQDVEKTRLKIESLNPTAEIIETTQARIGDFFAVPQLRTTLKPSLAPFIKQNPSYPRPGNYVLLLSAPQDIEAVKRFMLAILPDALRVKGIVQDDEGHWHYVDGVNKRVEERILNRSETEGRIVVIPKGGKDLTDILKQAWANEVATPMTIS